VEGIETEPVGVHGRRVREKRVACFEQVSEPSGIPEIAVI
jgi:hypothetical protein